MHVALNGWFWDQPTTGSGQYTRRLVEHLGLYSDDLRLTLILPRSNIPDPLPPHVHPHPTDTPRTQTAKVWFEHVHFPRTCRRLGADLAHVPYWGSPLHPTIPTLVTIHDLIPRLLPAYRGDLRVRLYTALVSQSARRATLAMTDSEASRQDIIEHLHLPASRVRSIPLAAGAAFTPEPTPEDKAIRRRYDLPPRYVLYLGGFDIRKNVATLLAAYQQAAPHLDPTHPLVIAGRLPAQDSAFSPNPRRLATELSLSREQIHFTGFVDDAHKPALYRGASAFLFPSRYEGFGLPPLEALSCGTPVICSDRASLPEVVGPAGITLPPDDVTGIARALVKIVNDPDFHATLMHRATQQAARFSWQQTAQQTMAAYRMAYG